MSAVVIAFANVSNFTLIVDCCATCAGKLYCWRTMRETANAAGDEPPIEVGRTYR